MTYKSWRIFFAFNKVRKLEKIDQRQRRNARTKILMLLSEQPLELVCIFIEENKIFFLLFFFSSRGQSKNLEPYGQGFGSASGSAWIRINLSCWIRIGIRIQIADPAPDPGGKKWPTKIEKSTEFSCFEVLDVFFWGLKASPVAWASFMEAWG
jgi:hypothetical protein